MRHGAVMRPVVLLWENFGPYHRDRMRALQATGRKVIGIQFSAGSNTYAWADEPGDCDIRTLSPDGHRSRWRLTIRLLRELIRIGRADWFLCHYNMPAVFIAAMVLRLSGQRVFALFDSKFDDYPRRLGAEIVKWWAMLPYSGALTGSPRSRDYLRFLGVPGHGLRLGYDTLAVARIRALVGAPADVPFHDRDWVVVARLVPKKNIALAIEGYARWLSRTARPRDLHLCGSGPLEAELRALATRLGVAARVHFHGFVQTDAVARRLTRSLALLLPSVEEQFGLVVIEAQACGLPVLVSTAVGAGDMLVDAGVNGFILTADRPDNWAATMLLLSEDEGRWRAMAAAAREGADRGDVARFIEGVVALTGEK